MGFAILSAGMLRFSTEADSLVQKKRFAYPFKRANGRSPARNPVQIRSPKDRAIQWQGNIKFDPDRLDKQRGPGVSPAVFSPIFGRPKMGPPEAKQRCGPLPDYSAAAPAGGEFLKTLQNAPHRQGVDGGVEEDGAPEGAGAIIGPGQHQARGQVLEHEKKIGQAVADHSELPHVEESKEKA